MQLGMPATLPPAENEIQTAKLSPTTGIMEQAIPTSLPRPAPENDAEERGERSRSDRRRIHQKPEEPPQKNNEAATPTQPFDLTGELGQLLSPDWLGGDTPLAQQFSPDRPTPRRNLRDTLDAEVKTPVGTPKEEPGSASDAAAIVPRAPTGVTPDGKRAKTE